MTARYYTLSDSSLNFVKLTMSGDAEYTLPQSVSGSGARYTDDMMLTWWVKGDSATVEMRDDDGQWRTVSSCCAVENP
jgi:membrane-bound inhibitor of C-type lysozyme